MAKQLPTITGVHVDSVALERGRFAIGWTIGADRFHVWGERNTARELRRERANLAEKYRGNPEFLATSDHYNAVRYRELCAPGAIGRLIGHDTIEDTVYKNPVAARGEPGFYETRQLDRNSAAQSAIFAAVLEIVTRDNLVGQAFQAERDKRNQARRRAELDQAIAAIEAEALTAFRRGELELLDDLRLKHRSVTEQRAELDDPNASQEAA